MFLDPVKITASLRISSSIIRDHPRVEFILNWNSLQPFESLSIKLVDTDQQEKCDGQISFHDSVEFEIITINN